MTHGSVTGSGLTRLDRSACGQVEHGRSGRESKSCQECSSPLSATPHFVHDQACERHQVHDVPRMPRIAWASRGTSFSGVPDYQWVQSAGVTAPDKSGRVAYRVCARTATASSSRLPVNRCRSSAGRSPRISASDRTRFRRSCNGCRFRILTHRHPCACGYERKSQNRTTPTVARPETRRRTACNSGSLPCVGNTAHINGWQRSGGVICQQSN